MKCAELLTTLETGGKWGQRRARRHAARCARCAAAFAAFAEMKRQMAVVEPLSAAQRRLWTRVSGAGASVSSRWRARRVWVPVTTGLLAACAALVIWRVVWWRPVGDGGGSKTPEATVVEVIEPVKQLESLAAAVDELDRQVEQLKERARRGAVRREVAMAVERYRKW